MKAQKEVEEVKKVTLGKYVVSYDMENYKRWG